jgi:hypothetical protein
MPISKKRKKKGKVVRSRRRWTDAEIAEMNRPAGVSLQDLINVVAAQEYQKDPEGYMERHPVVEDQQEDPEDAR